MQQNIKFKVDGMTCSSCVSHVNKAVSKIDGVKDVNVSLLTNSMLVTYEDKVTPKEICQAVSKVGYKASLYNKKVTKTKEKNEETFSLKIKLIISLILLIPLFYIGMGYMFNMEYMKTIFPLGTFGENEFYVALTELLLSATIMLINKNFYILGFKNLIHRTANMDTLVALGSFVPFVYSVAMMFVMSFYAKQNDFENVMKTSMNLSFETAGMVPTLITIGKTLESYSKGKTTSAIKGLLDLTPKTAHLIKEGKEEIVEVNQIQLNDTFLVLPGESFPVDGKVIEGNSSVDESCLSGESLPIDKEKDSKVFAGTININGALTCTATNIGNETTVNRIAKLVEEASSTKTKISKIADTVAGFFVPLVISISIIVFIFWYIFGKDFVSSIDTSTTILTYSINKAISVLVISCPCALGLATPVAIMVGNGKGAKKGILFKSAAALEETSKIDYVVLDKTGTITKGKPTVTDIYTKLDYIEFLKISSSIESKSEHPLSKAILERCKEEKIKIEECQSFKAIIGKGVKCLIDGRTYYGGNLKLMNELSLTNDEYLKMSEEYSSQGKTPLFFANEKEIIGIIAVSDVIKEDSKVAIQAFKNLGITPLMLTGDNSKTANVIAEQVGIENYISDVLPDEKLHVIESLQEHGKVMMIGDGINDAPALTKANVGVAIGAGSDIAIDSADIVLTKSTLIDAVNAILLSKKTMKNIKENLFWAFFYNIIMIPIAAGCFAALGLAKLRPWMGAAAMALSSICVVLNALRLNLYNYKMINISKESKCKSVPTKLIQKKKSKIIKTIKIDDMMCENCVEHVKSTLESFKEVDYAMVSLKDLNATIYLKEEIDINKLLEAIKKEGYNPTIE